MHVGQRRHHRRSVGADSPITVSQLNNGNIYVVQGRGDERGRARACPPRPRRRSSSASPGRTVDPVGRLRPGAGVDGLVEGLLPPRRGERRCDHAVPRDVHSGRERRHPESSIGSSSPIIVSDCSPATPTRVPSPRPTSSAPAIVPARRRATVGTPAPPNVLGGLKLAHGIALPFSPPASNGHPITDYRARCTSSNGGVPSSPLQFSSPIVINKLSLGKTYVCLVTAINARGESPPRTVGPVVIATPTAANLAVLLRARRKRSGEPRALAGRPQAAYLLARRDTRVVFRAVRACRPDLGIVPLEERDQLRDGDRHTQRGVGNSDVDLARWAGNIGSFDSTRVRRDSGPHHPAHFSGWSRHGRTCSPDAHVNGTLVLQRGLDAAASGGDCATASHGSAASR